MKETCFPRQEYLQILQKRVAGLKEGYRQNVAFIGDELVGKTTIVCSYLQQLCDNRIIPLYLEARPEPLAQFCRRFCGVLLYNFLSQSGSVPREDLSLLMEKCSVFIPRTVEKIRQVLSDADKKKKEGVFAGLLCLCDIIHQETGKCCLVIFDEFQYLEQIGFKQLYREWAQSIMVQKSTMYVLVSSLRSRAQEILAKDLSLLFGNFELIEVLPFDSRTSEDYLVSRIGFLPLSERDKQFIINFTGGYPFYLKVISDHLAAGAGGSLVDVLEELLFAPAGVLSQRFAANLRRLESSSACQECVNLLYHIASGHNRLKDIAHLMRRTQKEALTRVNALIALDMVSRSGDFLVINDRVFSFWLKSVYQGRQQALSFNAQSQQQQFRSRVQAMLDDFFLAAARPVPDRITELLRLFGDERIQMERKKLKLAHFREIKPVEFRSRGLREGLICRSQDSSLWVIAFRNELMTEEDISGFSQECRKYRQKLERKIIVSLDNLDPNSRLRALEEKIWTWDINHLNMMFDMFSKPRIVSHV